MKYNQEIFQILISSASIVLVTNYLKSLKESN